MPTIDLANGLGRTIGSNADSSTSIVSSSSTSESTVSMELFSFIASLWADNGGLDDDGRDEVGETRDAFRLVRGIVSAGSGWNCWPVGMPRILASSYGRNGFFISISG